MIGRYVGGIKDRKKGILFTRIFLFGGLVMSKPMKTKKDKVPKITEEEYANYISSLRNQSESEIPPQEQPPKKSE